jgi:hypothetical protein
MTKVFREVFTKVGEYQTPEGNTKARFRQCGVIIEKQNGKLALKMDLFPDWFELFEPKPPEARQSKTIEEEPPF